MRSVFVLASILVLVVASLASAQTIHLQPVHRPLLAKDQVVLRIDAVKSSDMDGGQIGIQNGELVIVKKTKRIDTISLKDRTVKDLISEVQANYPDQLIVSTTFPLYSTSILHETEPTNLIAGSPVEVFAAPDVPEVALSFGLVMAPSGAAPSADRRSLLSKAGFQLDVLGTLQFYAPAKGVRRMPAFYAQARLGLHTSQEVSVTSKDAPTGNDAISPQVETVLAQADQAALTLQLPIVFAAANNMDVIFTPTVGTGWTQLEPFSFPSISVEGTLVEAKSLFDAQLFEATQRRLDRTLPLLQYGGIATINFRRANQPIFYIGGGLERAQRIEREVSFRRTPSAPGPDRAVPRDQAVPSAPLRTSLQAVVKTPSDLLWRWVAGFRMAGILDVRVDAAGPTNGNAATDPVLRIVVGRAFPVKAN